MALVKVGAIITDIKGKVGGQYFARNIGGLSLRNMSNHSKGPHGINVKKNTILSIVAAEWAKLTSAQRTAWDVFAGGKGVGSSKGENIYLRGYSLFNKYNYYYHSAYDTVLTTPVFASAKTRGVTCTLEVKAGPLLFINISRALVAADEFLFFYISGIRPTSRSIDFKSLREIGYIKTSIATLDIETAYTDYFGHTLSAADMVYLKWILLDKQGNIVQTERGIKTIVT